MRHMGEMGAVGEYLGEVVAVLRARAQRVQLELGARLRLGERRAARVEVQLRFKTKGGGDATF